MVEDVVLTTDNLLVRPGAPPRQNDISPTYDRYSVYVSV